MKRALLSLTCFALASPAQADPLNLTPGDWSVTIGVMAAGKSHTDTMTACMTEADTSMEPVEMAQAFAGGADCSASNISQSGNEISFSMACSGQEAGLVSADLSLLNMGSSFDMDGPIKLRLDNGSVIDGTMTIAAKRQGVCTD